MHTAWRPEYFITDRARQDYEFYVNAYDHQYGYYDEYQHYVQDRAD